MTQEQAEKRTFLPLGSVVILKGSVKKLIIVSRASIVENKFFDYGAAMYPEGMIDSKIAYFNHENIAKIVDEGYTDDDETLVLEILRDAYAAYQRDQSQTHTTSTSVQAETPASVPTIDADDPFASVRDLGDDDE